MATNNTWTPTYIPQLQQMLVDLRKCRDALADLVRSAIDTTFMELGIPARPENKPQPASEFDEFEMPDPATNPKVKEFELDEAINAVLATITQYRRELDLLLNPYDNFANRWTHHIAPNGKTTWHEARHILWGMAERSLKYDGTPAAE